MTEPIDKKTFNRQLARLAVPIAIQSLMLALVAACDVLIILDYDFGLTFPAKHLQPIIATNYGAGNGKGFA